MSVRGLVGLPCAVRLAETVDLLGGEDDDQRLVGRLRAQLAQSLGVEPVVASGAVSFGLVGTEVGDGLTGCEVHDAGLDETPRPACLFRVLVGTDLGRRDVVHRDGVLDQVAVLRQPHVQQGVRIGEKRRDHAEVRVLLCLGVHEDLSHGGGA